ncbi:MAG: TIGR00289 family protein [Candidatus Diapherotrites archaeon CG11_big_fil_rev_8_21_14_0_20_37_9]|nr:MAG: TIGR00289 family protein [Candidatus Diapherotrites archaeon CG11_big_fil_rev_8_21_14_0_20_37_9]
MVGILFSGGKDSVFSLYYYLEQGWDIKCLISLKSSNKESWMFHTPAISLVELQAKAIGLPIIVQETGGEKEKELLDLELALKRAKKEFGIKKVVVGALLSDYQQERVNRVGHNVNLKCHAPLWHKNQEKLLREIIYAGFDVRISGIASAGLSEKWLGRQIDAHAVDELVVLNKKIGLHVGGEGGEYESMVLDGPIFKKRVQLNETKKVVENEFKGRLDVISASLIDK